MAARIPLPTPEQVAEGTVWYPAARGIIDRLTTDGIDATGDYDLTPEIVAGVIGAFSQNATWKANMTMARNYVTGKGQNGMARVMAEIAAIEDGASPTDYAILGLKRADFAANMLGDLSRVTCDRWHLRAAFGDRKVALTPEVHALVTAATRIVAAEFGEEPATCQAVIWCAIRGTGA